MEEVGERHLGQLDERRGFGVTFDDAHGVARHPRERRAVFDPEGDRRRSTDIRENESAVSSDQLGQLHAMELREGTKLERPSDLLDPWQSGGGNISGHSDPLRTAVLWCSTVANGGESSCAPG